MEYLFCLERKSALKFGPCVLSWQPKVSDTSWLVVDNIPLLPLPLCTYWTGSAHTEQDWHKHFLIELQMLKDGVIILVSLRGKSAHAKKWNVKLTQPVALCSMCGCSDGIILHFCSGTLSLYQIADSVQFSAAGSRERLLLVTSLSKKRFVPSCTHSSYSTRRPVICCMCVDVSSASPSSQCSAEDQLCLYCMWMCIKESPQSMPPLIR